MNHAIEGTWHSYYEYGQGPDNTPQSSEHTIEFLRDHDTGGYVGYSQPDEEVTITIHRIEDYGPEFRGEWHERTSPTGHYGGQELGGTILLLLQADGNELNGMRTGANRDQTRVKAGVWKLKRERSNER